MKKVRTSIGILLALLLCLGSIVPVFAGNEAYGIENGAAIFNSEEKLEYFNASGVVKRLTIAYSSNSNAAKLTVTGSDPYTMISYDALGITNLTAEEYPYVILTYKVASTVTATPKSQIFYCAGSVTEPTGGYSADISLTKDGVYHSAIVKLSNYTGWTGTIHALRLDPFTSAVNGESMYVDSIILAKTSAEAKAIAAYREDKANGEIDDASYTVSFDENNFASYISFELGSGVAGDINSDGGIDARDIIFMKKYLAGVEKTFDSEKYDLTNDGIVNMKDSLMLKKMVFGIIQSGGSLGGIASATYDGAVKLTAISTTPYVDVSFANDGTLLPAAQYEYVVIRYKAEKSGTASIVPTAGGAEGAAHSFNVTGDGAYHTAVVKLGGDSAWSGNNPSFRLNFFDSATAGDTMYIESISLAETAAIAAGIN